MRELSGVMSVPSPCYRVVFNVFNVFGTRYVVTGLPSSLAPFYVLVLYVLYVSYALWYFCVSYLLTSLLIFS